MVTSEQAERFAVARRGTAGVRRHAGVVGGRLRGRRAGSTVLSSAGHRFEVVQAEGRKRSHGGPSRRGVSSAPARGVPRRRRHGARDLRADRGARCLPWSTSRVSCRQPLDRAAPRSSGDGVWDAAVRCRARRLRGRAGGAGHAGRSAADRCSRRQLRHRRCPRSPSGTAPTRRAPMIPTVLAGAPAQLHERTRTRSRCSAGAAGRAVERIRSRVGRFARPADSLALWCSRPPAAGRSAASRRG